MHKYLSLLTLLPITLLASETHEFQPLYAGTLLAFYPTNISPAHFSIQPYIFATGVYGAYDKNWSLHSQKTINNNILLLSLETGITDYLDVTLTITESYNHTSHKHTWRYGDTILYFGFQLMQDQRGTWKPDMRLLLGEIFPTGKCNHLHPSRATIDTSGFGSYQTAFIYIVRKIFYTYPHPFSVNLNLLYFLPTSTHVKGLNTYGGGPGTKGTVHPGNTFITNLGLELALTRNWELGLDIRYEQQNKSPFSGHTIFPTGLPSSARFSLAPCIEYNFNEKFSVAAGLWFSIAGRNNTAFVSGIANVFYLF